MKPAIRFFHAGESPHIRRKEDWRGMSTRRYPGFIVVYRGVPWWAAPLAVLGGLIDHLLTGIAAGVHFGEPSSSPTEPDPENGGT